MISPLGRLDQVLMPKHRRFGASAPVMDVVSFLYGDMMLLLAQRHGHIIMNPHRRTESSLIYSNQIGRANVPEMRPSLAIWTPASGLRRKSPPPHLLEVLSHVTSAWWLSCVLVDTRAACRFSTSTKRPSSCNPYQFQKPANRYEVLAAYHLGIDKVDKHFDVEERRELRRIASSRSD